eukprot:5724903-Amphidinium_carterae.1
MVSAGSRVQTHLCCNRSSLQITPCISLDKNCSKRAFPLDISKSTYQSSRHHSTILLQTLKLENRPKNRSAQHGHYPSQETFKRSINKWKKRLLIFVVCRGSRRGQNALPNCACTHTHARTYTHKHARTPHSLTLNESIFACAYEKMEFVSE